MALIINGQRVDDALVEQEFANVKAYYESLGNVSCCERDPEFRETARRNILTRVLLSQEAGRSVPETPAAELDAAVDKLVDDYGGREWFYARTGASEESMNLVRRDVDLELRTRRLVDRMDEEAGPPTEAQLRAHYETNIEAFKTAEEVRASHILKNPARAEDRAAAYDLLRGLRRQLREQGADFDELALKHSDKAEEHVDLGFFKRNELTLEFEVVAFSLDVGEVSPVFLSQFGYHLIKLTGRKPATPKPFDEVRDEVEQHFRGDRRERMARELVERLKASATIEEVTESETAPQGEATTAEVGAS